MSTERRLDPEGLCPDPMEQLRLLVAEATADDPNATLATICTSGAEGAPSARIVPVRGIDERGIEIHTSLASTKGRHFLERPDSVCALFFWPVLMSQARLHGCAVPLDEEASSERFAGLPRRAQLRAWIHAEGAGVEDRDAAEELVRSVEERFEGSEVPRPPDWRIVRIEPDRLDLFQMVRSTLVDDRVRYDRQPDGSWRLTWTVS